MVGPSKRVVLLPYLFMLPALLVALAASIYPVYVAFQWSLHNTSFTEMKDFIGLRHYVRLLMEGDALPNLGRSLIYVVSSLVLALPLATSVALALNQKIPFRSVFRTIVIMPWVVSQTITALLFRWAFNPDYGAFSRGLQQLGLPNIDFFSYSFSAMAVLVVANVWMYYPIAVILILAALQTIAVEVYEAARVDGAQGWALFAKITLPLIQPTIMVVMIQLTLLFFNMVTLMYILTGGGPFSATEVLSLRAFKVAFQNWNLGYASALSFIIFLANLVFSVGYIRLLQREGRS